MSDDGLDTDLESALRPLEVGRGHQLGSNGEPLPDDARGSFLLGWLAGAHAEGFITRDEAERILRERSEPNGDQVKG